MLNTTTLNIFLMDKWTYIEDLNNLINYSIKIYLLAAILYLYLTYSTL